MSCPGRYLFPSHLYEGSTGTDCIVYNRDITEVEYMILN